MHLLTVLEYKSNKEIESKNYSNYIDVCKLKYKLDNIGKFQLDYKLTKFYKVDKLKYYSMNNISLKYKSLADTLVKEYILPHSPKKVHKSDIAYQKQIVKTSKSFDETYIEPEKDSTIQRDYISMHRNSHSISSRLDEIANKILKMYDDELTLQDGLKYADLAFEYLDLPEYKITKAKIEYKLGNYDGAIQTLNQLRSHKFYNYNEDVIEDLIIEFTK
jgi:hypothetical protein